MEEELLELRTRSDANDVIVDVLVTFMLSEAEESLRRVITLHLRDWTEDPGPRMKLSEAEAIARSDQIVMMQSALRGRVGRIAEILRTSELLDLPAAPLA